MPKKGYSPGQIIAKLREAKVDRRPTEHIAPDTDSAESCCRDEIEARGVSTYCPACGLRGKDLDEITLKALLRGKALARCSEGRHHFCATHSCPLVYFGEHETFSRDDLTVPIFQKESKPKRPVCYCFDVSEADIQREIALTGRSTASQRIRALVNAGRCACEVKNPQGSCCLGNVAIVERADREKEAAPLEDAKTRVVD